MNARIANLSTQEHQQLLTRGLGFVATGSQSQAIYALSRFLSSDKARCALLIRGYAGTGKTTLMRSLVKHLRSQGSESVLLAPTGRAAKVLAQYTGHMSSTIHRAIYRRSMDANGNSRFSLAPNKRKRVTYIVDEASMLGNERGVLYNGLLDDLMEHIYSGEACRLILLGDDAQLPPVGLSESPALDIDTLRAQYDLTIASCILTDVVRQEQDSAILSLATVLRAKVFGQGANELRLEYSLGPEVYHISSAEIAEELESCYDSYGKEQVRVICRSNRSANRYNQQIRNQLFHMDDRLCAGELIMIVRNNYLWAEEKGKMPFIANGELAEVLYVKDQRRLYEHDFARIGIAFPDAADEPSLECMAMLDTLEAESASLAEDQMKELYQQVRADLSQESSPSALQEKMQKSPWYNALQIKFGYAITCHKSQGGQWPVVFVDKGYLNQEMLDRDFWRWMYTAVTRATERLYLIDM